MTPSYHLDANVVLRFLRDDDPRQSPAAARLFASAQAGKARLRLSAVTVAEIFSVLARVYRHKPAGAAAILLPLAHSSALAIDDRDCITDALGRVAQTGVDFGDAYLAAIAAKQGDSVASFDQDLLAFKDIKTFAPS